MDNFRETASILYDLSSDMDYADYIEEKEEEITLITEALTTLKDIADQPGSIEAVALLNVIERIAAMNA